MVSRSYGLGSLLFPGLPGFMHGVAAHLPAVEPPGLLLARDTPLPLRTHANNDRL